jgi:hypothetical protein
MADTDRLDNSPEMYDELTDRAKAVLQAWIQHALVSASVRSSSWSSSFLKQEFEAVGFDISNGAFKGAMRAAGYEPKKRSDAPDWYFAVRPRAPGSAVRKRPPILRRGETFTLKYLTSEEHVAFNALVEAAHELVHKPSISIQPSPEHVDTAEQP